MDEEDEVCFIHGGEYLSLSTSQLPLVERRLKVKPASYYKLPQFLQDVLSQLDLLVSSCGPCIIVKGGTGTCKTTVLRTLASAYGKRDGNGLVTLHLGEQVDSKMLLGTYTSTKVPGEFLWLPGVLTKALSNGQWVLLEDIQSAPAEVVTLLLTLVKNGKLMIPGYNRPLKASDGFKLLLTWRITEDAPVLYTQASSVLSVLEQHCAVVSLQKLGLTDMQQVLSGRYPGLDAISEQLSSFSLTQQVHIRHILKFCDRVCTQLYDGRITSVEDFMLEAIDCFCGGLPLEKRVSVACELRALCGGISKEKVEQLCMSHKPSICISPTAVAIGRAHLDRQSSQELRFCYAHTQGALCLLEKIGRCVQLNEPVLLVGETGVGKTAAVNYLANITGNKLVVINMSQQTDSSDLLGGFKPVQTSQLVAPYREKFEWLFHSTFSVKQNAQYLASVQAAFTKQQWTKLFRLMLHSVSAALARLKGKMDETSSKLHDEWNELSESIKTFKTEMRKPQAVFSFSFVEGALVEAVSHGWWILLDEINLATPEVLQCLSSLLEGPDGSFLLPEKATSTPVKRHNNFRLFCCMNPATDVGKKSLPHSIRNRFTEFFVDEFQSSSDLQLIVLSYLKDLSPKPPLVDGSIKLYRVMKEYAENRLNDGTGRKPHYSMRSLCRALYYAARCLCGSLQRSLYEGFCMTFLSELHQDYHQLVMGTILKTLGISSSCVTASIPRPPSSQGGQQRTVQVEGFWLSCGEEQAHVSTSYVLVSSVKKNLKNLARVVSARKYPVLLQGPTSAGKTSLVQYLATVTGHKCLRINNHDHTDLQEYVGMYTANSKGQLVFQEGVLVNAMRNGYWIILDELNLAPTEVLEALNRVLDDNRELFIPETQQLVKAHPEFLVFGTQNPPGTYGGRKVLSRAFRNRFIELHFEDIPPDEVVTILQERCAMPPSYARRMVSVMKELQQRRSISGIFSGKYGLITMRDLFRWAERYRRSETKDTFHDWEQQLAEDGFMLLGGRLRENQEQEIILEVLQKHFKRTVDPVKLFGLDGGSGSLASRDSLCLLKQTLPEKFAHLVWTDELLKNAVLLCRAVQFDEPVLLVGNTGCGKTTLCSLLSFLLERKFFTINCHMHTEAADFLGGLGPVRNRGNKEDLGLFEWRDGVVVDAMREGGVLLIDEISLADDAVLERLNSVLEPERKLLVSERSWTEGEVYEITATNGFVFLGTMNPGGDYGKKELSPALRNRFVEIWCSSASSCQSYQKIIEHNLKEEFTRSETHWSSLMLDVIEWLKQTSRAQVSVRDLLAWVNFMNVTASTLFPQESFYHGAHLVFLDGIGCSGSGGERSLRQHALTFLDELLVQKSVPLDTLYSAVSAPENQNGKYGIAPFFISTGPHECLPLLKYSLAVSGPCQNAFKLLRAMQLDKPLLLEGVPGVGKTTLVTALARASGHHVVRINLSEQTDISDLFGSDLPVEGGTVGQFAWRDGPCLTALKNGNWILLDEMNLASQSVLEGLNACLDHRGEIYIPELGMVFKVKRGTRFFACQNPLQQGGGRKGLPKSFTNRFTQVYIDALSQQDLLFIAASLYPQLGQESLDKMITFTTKVCDLVRKECGDVLWEFNLRDVLRWCELMQKHQPSWCLRPEQYVELIYCCRLRDSTLRTKVLDLFKDVFDTQSGSEHTRYSSPTKLGTYFHGNNNTVQIGNVVVKKGHHLDHHNDTIDHPLLLLHSQMSTMEALVHCVDMGWMAILVGSSCSGKSSVVKCLAQLTGNKLVEFPMNSDTDTTELLGGFEQVNMGRQCSNLASLCHDMVTWLQHVIKTESPSSGINHYEETLVKMDAVLLEKYTLEGSDNDEVNRSCQELVDVIKQLKDISKALDKQLPYDIDEIAIEVESLSTRSQSSDSCGQFEWVDSVLVKALKYGHWLLISHANFCSPSVLDRLNPLLEPGGCLSIDERGYINGRVPVVHPHPNFRLFLTMDHAHGEISRAMRNRGIEIFMLPQQSLCTAKHCRSDWLSLVRSCGIDDVVTASQIVEMCQALPDISPCKLLHIVKSYILLKGSGEAGNGPTDILSVLFSSYGNHLDKVMELTESQNQQCVLFAAPAFDYFSKAPQAVVQRDLVPLLEVVNQIITTGTEESSMEHSSQALAFALQVFVSCATSEDLNMRVAALKQLSYLLKYKTPSSHSDEVRMEIQNLLSLNDPPVTLKVQNEGVCIKQLLPSTNPLLTVAIDGIKTASVLLELFVKTVVLERAVEKHVQAISVSGTKSLLQFSYAVCKGTVPSFESLLHPSLKHIYSHILELLELQKLAILANSEHQFQTPNMLLSCPELMSVLVEVCSLSSCSLSSVACAWMLFKAHSIPTFNSLLKSETDKNKLQELLEKFHLLESVLYVSRFYDTLKTMLGCPSVPSIETMKYKNVMAEKDTILRYSVAPLQPLLLLNSQACEERMKLLNTDISSLLNSTETQDVNTCPPFQDPSNILMMMHGALQPAVLCSKRLMSSCTREGDAYATQLKSLLNYCTRISFIDISHLLRCKDVITHTDIEKLPVHAQLPAALFECCSSGFSVDHHKTIMASHSAAACNHSACSELCFSMLAHQNTEEEGSHTQRRQALFAIGTYCKKAAELQMLLQYLWLNGSTQLYSPSEHLASEHQNLQSLLILTLSAINTAAQSCNSGAVTPSKPVSTTELTIQETCAAARKALHDEALWNRVEKNLLLVQASLKEVHNFIMLLSDNGRFGSKEEERITCILGSAQVHLGVVLGLLLSPSSVDPVAIAGDERHCVQSLVNRTKTLVDSWDHHYHNMVGVHLQDMVYGDESELARAINPPGVAPNVYSLLQRKQLYKELLQSTPLAVASRVNKHKYPTLTNMCVDLMSTLCAPVKVETLLSDVLSHTHHHGKLSLALRRHSSWSQAVSASVRKLQEEYAEYPDVVEPFTMALLQMLCGMNSIAVFKKCAQRTLLEAATIVTRYQRGDCSQLEYMSSLLVLIRSGIEGLGKEERHSIMKWMIQVALDAARFFLANSTALRSSLLSVMSELLHHCWQLWTIAEERAKRKSQEEESLYRYKSKTHLITKSETREEELQLEAMFPSYDKQFDEDDESEVNSSGDNDMGESCDVDGGDLTVEFTVGEMEQVVSNHFLLFNKAACKTPLPAYTSASLVKSSYSLASKLITLARGTLPGLHYDHVLMEAHITMCSGLLSSIESQSATEKPDRLINVYKDAFVSESQKVFPILSNLMTRVQELLMEWPDHPTLSQVLSACERVLSLDIHEPLMKILSGLEFVLKKTQDWEAYASSSVSLFSQLESLTGLVLEWRKLELNSWKRLLSMCVDEVKTNASKWWFHLYGLCSEYKDKCDDPAAVDEFISALQRFMETSTVGEFEIRLQMVESYHREIEATGGTVTGIANILGNVMKFYQQFMCSVEKVMKDLTMPIDKEFNEFLTILRWNDGNYWALKSSAEKSHRALLKLVNKYKAVLHQPVKPLLSDSSLSSEEADGEGESKLQAVLHRLKSVSYLVQINDIESSLVIEGQEFELTSSAACLRMRSFVHKFTTTGDVCFQWSESIDGLTGDISETAHYLQSVDYLKGVVEEKRKAAIKLNGLRKRKALSDLFKTLKQQGLSYRRGAEFCDDVQSTTLKLPCKSPPNQLGCITKLWESTEHYYYECVARMAGLHSAFSNPSKELTVGQITRCKGYARYLMKLLCDERNAFAIAFDSLNALWRCSVFMKKLESCLLQIIPIKDYKHWQSTLCTCLEQSLQLISKFSSLVECMPPELDLSLTPVAPTMLPPLTRCGNRSIAESALGILKTHCGKLEQLYASNVKLEGSKFESYATIDEVADLKLGYESLTGFLDSLTDVISLTTEEATNVGLLEFLHTTREDLRVKCIGFSEWVNSIENSFSCEPSEDSVEDYHTLDHEESVDTSTVECREMMTDLAREIVIRVQKVMVRHKANFKSVEEGDEDVSGWCKDLHTTSLENLTDMRADVVLDKVSAAVSLLCLQEQPKEAIELLQAVNPLLDQYKQLYQKIVVDLILAHCVLCKLLLVLVQMFNTLAQKGFCTPPEETEEEGQGTEFVGMEAGGFDEGEGQQNVSSQAEASNLDPGDKSDSKEESKENGNEQENEEEDAVEMSEDFGGSLEDVDNTKDDQDSSEESDGEEDTNDLEMGKLGSDEVDELDRNMWAPEDEEQKDEQELDEQESGGGTSLNEETKMVAKEDADESEQSPQTPTKPTTTDSIDEDSGLPEDTEHSELQPGEEEKEDTAVDETDFGDLSLDDVEDDNGENDQDEGRSMDGSEKGEEEEEGGSENDKPAQATEQEEDEKEDDLEKDGDDLNALWAADQRSFGVDSDNMNPTERDQSNANATASMQETTEGSSTEVSSVPLSGGVSGTVASSEDVEQQSEEQSVPHRRAIRPENRRLADSEERAVKRPRLMQSHSDSDPLQSKQWNEDHSSFRHIDKDTPHHDAVAWDTADMDEALSAQHTKEREEGSVEPEEMEVTEEQDERDLPAGGISKSENVPHSTGDVMESQEEETVKEEEEMKVDDSKTSTQSLQSYTDTFFSSGNFQQLENLKSEPVLRDDLKTAVSVLRSLEQEDQDVTSTQLWVKYELLMSSLSQMLSEELRLILLPTKATQLKGDFRTGKRLNMRRIIPYIASNFQNDRIWLRRTKPSKREYQILIAVDDSSSMNENNCNQMAYESLALISTALSRLDSGQLGVCRFGESVEILHPLGQPFTASSGGFILKQLTFTQTKTNFIHLLESTQSIFVKNQSRSSTSSISLEINQLLVVLSDGRGVFADGSLPIEIAIRNLNQMGVFTVFIILDSLSKDSIVDIKVPTFIPGKPPIIKAYLDTFPFSFYVVLRDISKMPVVLGQALRQWFELISSQ